MTLDRRAFLTGLGAASLGAAARPAAAETTRHGLEADGPPQRNPLGGPAARMPAIEFHGRHQAGIRTRPQPSACFAAFDVTARNRREVKELFRTLTHHARFPTSGGAPHNLGLAAPPADAGTLGPTVPADGLTVTVSVGASLFDRRYGIAHREPKHLTTMRPFPNGALDPDQTGGDLLLQLCAGAPDVTVHALRELAKHTRDAMQLRWRIDGFVAPPRPSGVPRNHLGFKDGIAHPDVQDPVIADKLLWLTAGIGEPGWARGGSYHVCRIIKMDVEFWDRVSLTEQQQMIGRFRDTGGLFAVGHHETDIPHYRHDPHGRKIPLDAHIRLANRARKPPSTSASCAAAATTTVAST